jgi:predicted nucleic acid-binding Zn finger protein
MQQFKSFEFNAILQGILNAEGLILTKGEFQIEKNTEDGTTHVVLSPLDKDELQILVFKHLEGLEKTYNVVGTEEDHIVSQFKSGLWTCTCLVYMRRLKECHHIRGCKVRVTDERPKIVLANVEEITQSGDIVLVPLVRPQYNRHFISEDVRINLAYLIERGYSIAKVKKMFGITMSGGKLFDELIEYFQRKVML